MPSKRFSPNDWTRATELGRPTVNGNNECGKRTVSRTGKMGSSSVSCNSECLCWGSPAVSAIYIQDNVGKRRKTDERLLDALLKVPMLIEEAGVHDFAG